MPKLVDCFIFYNELALLEYRLHLLYKIIDYFILVESNTTFVGNQKKEFYQIYKERFSQYADKIIHVQVHDMPITENAWEREAWQRNAIQRGLSQITLENNDLILISDVDEIPNPKLLPLFKRSPLNNIIILTQDWFFYNPTLMNPYPWNQAKLLPFSLYVNKYNKSAQQVRDEKYAKEIINGGWHFSYFGDISFIKNKLLNFSHQEFIKSHEDIEAYIQLCIIQKKIICFTEFDVNYKYIPVEENQHLPNDIHLLLQWLDDFKIVI